MHRSLPILGLALLIVLAGCLGGLGFGGSSDAATTTTRIETQTTSLRQPTTANIETPEDSERFQARVTKIIDPTTLKIKHNGKNRTVDLIGVSVPERGPIHKKAVRYTKSQMDHQVVTVVSDPEVGTTDDGHLRAYVYIGNFMVNSDLVRIGYARVPDGQFSKRQEFLQKQQQAKQRGYGRWNTTTNTDS
ncbi:thermonuclease family protein [Haladaptatus pallidirubidus]|uniref:TNase-like domain-containing protein n=1 Tax=Haladaptatus pallidirubidus TaxID=1008152 RepID=A0AAV3UMV6_9EURY|nr:thermonuclease family protein [Haladaptatus pallidirubidus]